MAEVESNTGLSDSKAEKGKNEFSSKPPKTIISFCYSIIIYGFIINLYGFKMYRAKGKKTISFGN